MSWRISLLIPENNLLEWMNLVRPVQKCKTSYVPPIGSSFPADHLQVVDTLAIVFALCLSSSPLPKSILFHDSNQIDIHSETWHLNILFLKETTIVCMSGEHVILDVTNGPWIERWGHTRMRLALEQKAWPCEFNKFSVVLSQNNMHLKLIEIIFSMILFPVPINEEYYWICWSTG